MRGARIAQRKPGTPAGPTDWQAGVNCGRGGDRDMVANIRDRLSSETSEGMEARLMLHTARV